MLQRSMIKNPIMTCGFILPTTLLMIALSTIILTYVITRSSVYIPYMQTMIDRQKASQLALGGVQIVMAEIGKPYETDANKKTAAQLEETTLFFSRIMPLIYQDQTFTLQGAMGDLGSIKICISSEDGKIDINQIYDYDKHIFKGEGQAKGDWKKIMQYVCERIEQIMGGKNLFRSFEKFLKERQYACNDVTELLTIKEFAIFKEAVFYDSMKTERKDRMMPLYLTDIFTVDGSGATIEPWLLSHSMVRILEFADIYNNEKDRDTLNRSIVQKFSRENNWQTMWNRKLGMIYGKELQSLPKGIDSMLNTQFLAKRFAVVSQGTSRSVTQRLLAVIEVNTQTSNNKKRHTATIKKMIWL